MYSTEGKRMTITVAFVLVILLTFCLGFLWMTRTLKRGQKSQIQASIQHQNQLQELREFILTQTTGLEKYHQQKTHELQQNLFDQLLKANDRVHQNHAEHLSQVQKTLKDALHTQTQDMTKRVDKLVEVTDQKLQQIQNHVNEKLQTGFEKTTSTFSDIKQRLALIDNAQKKLQDLSSDVVSLQQILIDKRSRGAFGEVQLKNLIHNMLPETHFSFQHVLNNQLRADCVLFLPPPTGNLVIDAKFPLENYQRWTNFDLADSERQKALQQFRQNVKKHIQDIAQKYIIPGETADGAVMFIPSEAIFAEIHAKLPELIQLAHQSNVWLASPTTMMAIITTASSVIKEDKTRKHIHIIQEHLGMLSKDFGRFDERMNKLAKHIDQAQEDVHQVQKSAHKISRRFQKIEQAEVKPLQEGHALEELLETDQSS